MKRLAALFAFAGIITAPPLAAKSLVPEVVRMSIDETPIVPILARELGFLEVEGITIEQVSIESFAPNDFEMQKPMREGKIDVAYHWFHHAVFGARHGLPVTAVMLFNDAPGMTVFVESSKAGNIGSPAGFRGRNIAAGAGYGTKALVTHTLAARSGLSAADYRLVHTAPAGREANVLAGLRDRSVDVVTAEEPMTSAVARTGVVAPLRDLTTRASTIRVLGAPWPAQSLLMSPGFLRRRPDTAQRVVNAFVRTMHWMEGKSAQEIAAHLPASTFAGQDREALVARIAATRPGYASGDYRIPPTGARMVIAAIEAYRFDDSASGQWRATRTVRRVSPSLTYDNRFVERAMRQIVAGPSSR